VKQGLITESRINEAVSRILTLKFDLGLFDRPLTDRSLLSLVRCPEHVELAKRVVRRSLVLLKNKGGVLPLSKSLKRIHVTGRGADDLGLCCGGWTTSWQGGSGRVTEGTTVLQGLKDLLGPDTIITTSRDGRGLTSEDEVAVVVTAEGEQARD